MSDEQFVINKKILSEYTYNMLGGEIEYKHILAVASILLEEIAKDMLNNKSIKIHNFMKMKIFNRKATEYHNCKTRKITLSPATKHIRMTFLPKVKRIFLDSLDVDKTLPSG